MRDERVWQEVWTTDRAVAGIDSDLDCLEAEYIISTSHTRRRRCCLLVIDGIAETSTRDPVRPRPG